MKTSIIIPCYNSYNIIKNTVSNITSELEKVQMDYQIILVNDCSRDNTYEAICEICKENNRVSGLDLSLNYGQQAARMAALPWATGDYIVFMDDDGQHPADGIVSLIDKLEQGYDIVYAHFKTKQHTLLQRMGSQINSRMAAWLVGKPKEISISSFFVVRRFVAEALQSYSSPFPYILGYLMRITRNIANVELEHLPRTAGKTGYTLTKLFALWLNGFTSFSVIPLRAASLVGLSVSGIGFLVGAGLVIRKLFHPEIQAGYTSIIATILFVGGMIMMMLGMLGEYVGRIFLSLNRLPQYVVRESVNLHQKEEG